MLSFFFPLLFLMGNCQSSVMFHKLKEKVCAWPITGTKTKGVDESKTKIKGTVVLMKKNVLDFNDMKASFLDRLHELLGKGVSMQLISAVNADPGVPFWPIKILLNYLSEYCK